MDDGRANQPKPVLVGGGVASAITPERWQRIKEVFGLALECELAGRSVLLQDACAGDEALRTEIESLLVEAEGNGAVTSEVFQSMSPPSSVPPKETADPMLGRRIGAYRLEKRIGYGGMASVYQASRADDEFRKRVAVKILRADFDNAELLKRFRNERQTLAVLDHANIVKLLDGGTTEEGLPYLVMDYVEGRPIDDYCDEHTLTVEQRLRLFCGVCEAVRCAHRSQVIHRDLKPNNILVAADGTPKLLDFGIAKVLSAQTAETVITRTATRHLTPAYASPEQVRGEPVTVATDVYSLGMVLYELLTGHRPYRLKQRTPAEMERAICEQEPESPSTAIDRVETERLADGTTVTKTAELVSRTRGGDPAKLRRNLRGDVDNILLKALEKDRQRRYASVDEFEQDIRNQLAQRPVKARRNTLTYRASRFAGRHATEVIAGATVLLILLAMVGFIVNAERRAAESVREEVANQRLRGRRSVAVLGFKNLSTRPDTAWLSTALSEMLTTELIAGGGIRTIPGEDIARTKISLSLPESESFSKATLRRVYQNLGSDFVISGSYLDLGDTGHNIRLDLRVQDAVLGETLASLVESGSEATLPDLVTRTGVDLREKLGLAVVSSSETARAPAVLPANPVAVKLYAEGLAKLRAFDVLSARDLLEKAVASDPSFAMAHSALADAWTVLGYDAKAKEEAKKASELAANLPREESLLIEGQYGQASKDWNRTTAIYQTLFSFFPDNLDYGLRLAGSQISNNKTTEALATLELLRRLPPPPGSDPRIDLIEARAAAAVSDYQRQARAAARAAVKGRALGSQLLVAQAKLDEGSALETLGDPKMAHAALDESRRLFFASGDTFGEANVLRGMGAVLLRQGDYPNAKWNIEESLRIARQIGNRASEANALDLLFLLVYRQGDLDAAKHMAEQSQAVAREVNDLVSQSRALNWIASVENDQGQFPSAEKHYEEALTVARESGNQGQVASVLNNLGTLYINQGDYARALSTLERCLTITRETGNKVNTGNVLITLSGTRLLAGEFGPAMALATEALQTFREAENQRDTGYALYTLAVIKGTQNDLVGAWADQQEALGIRERIGAKTDAANSRFSLAEIALERGRAADAEHLASQVVEYFHKEKLPSREGDAYRVLADSLRVQGRLSEAQSAVISAQATLADGEPMARARVTIVDARIRAASGNLAEALNLLEEVVTRAKKERWPDIEFDARLAIGELLKPGKPDAA